MFLLLDIFFIHAHLPPTADALAGNRARPPWRRKRASFNATPHLDSYRTASSDPPPSEHFQRYPDNLPPISRGQEDYFMNMHRAATLIHIHGRVIHNVSAPPPDVRRVRINI